MKTEIAIAGEHFLINGKPTYEGVSWKGRPVEGLLLNSRMVQAVFDDECPETAALCRYPDTGRWDPDRNTAEFCNHLCVYRRHGLLAVTVGLQGGGSVFAPDAYDRYVCSAFAEDGSLKPAYFERLLSVLRAADEAGMAVIVNYFYWKQAARFRDEAAVLRATEKTTEWLLGTGCRNILVDVANESGKHWALPVFRPENVHRLIGTVKGISRDGRRLPAGSSTLGGDALPAGKWLETEDFSMPHGNGLTAAGLTAKLRRLKEDPRWRKRSRPVVVNEDSIFVENLDAAVAEGCSWGFYCQGYGSGYKDLADWTTRPRETRYEDLSGFQTLPINWSINTPDKKAFFERAREIAQGQ